MTAAATREPLREIAHARQVPGENPRRWFSSADMDLVAWYAGDEIVGFQLCYVLSRGEHALTWRLGQLAPVHRAVDDGESSWQSAKPMRHKATPVLVPNGHWDPQELRALFLGEASVLPVPLVQRVLSVLDDEQGRRH